jgi:hypothetical protein
MPGFSNLSLMTDAFSRRMDLSLEAIACIKALVLAVDTRKETDILFC